MDHVGEPGSGVAVSNDATYGHDVTRTTGPGGGTTTAVRLYESLGGRAAGTLPADFPVTGVAFTDLLERPLGAGPGATIATGAELVFRPFQIATVRLSR